MATVWVDVGEQNFRDWVRLFDEPHRSNVGPFFGWLNAELKPYPGTISLKTYVHPRDHGTRTYIELERHANLSTDNSMPSTDVDETSMRS